MCYICGYPVCPQTCPVYTPPCYPTPACDPCTDEVGCKLKLGAECVTIGGTTLNLYLNPTNLLTYIYNSIIVDPIQYAKFCALWAACNGQQTCAAPTNIHISTITPTSAIVSWTAVTGVTYDVYVNNVLRQAGATSPLTISGLTAATSYSIKVTSACSNGLTNFATAIFSTTSTPNLIFTWSRTSGDVMDLTAKIDGTFDQIDWGDGTVNTSLTHTYVATGSYTVSVYNSTAATVILGNKIGSSIYKLTAVTALPATVVTLNLSKNTLTTLPSLVPLTSLRTLLLYNNLLTSLSITSNTALVTLGASDNPGLTGTLAIGTNTLLQWVEVERTLLSNVTGVGSCPALTLFQIGGNHITVTPINNALVALAGAGLLNGICVTSTQTPAAVPTGAGATAKATLLTNGWTVSTD